jgi:3-oxoacyl-[acyl-carrier protein] reductase
MTAPGEPRRVLVTGASGRIGGAIALRLARDGFKVTLHCRSRREEAEARRRELADQGFESDILCFDVTDRTQVRALLEEKMARDGAYYGIVCNAGVTRDNAFPGLTDEDWDTVVDTSLDGFFNVVQPLMLPMIRMRQGGRVVCIASVSGIIGNRGQVNYSAAKAGLIGAAKALAVELATRAITVNCVAPGLIESEMLDPETTSYALQAVPMKRIGVPADVADLVGFLFSGSASYITRQVIGVNGGLI